MTDPTTAPLVTALVDDAGLFPPTALPMDEAVARHRADDETANPVHTGRFLVPTSRVDELRQALREGESFRVGLILDESLDRLAPLATDLLDDPRLHLAGVELRLPPGDVDESVDDVQTAIQGVSAPVYVEIPLAQADGDETATALTALAGAGLGAKVRCGGVEPDLFPGAEQLADFLLAATRVRAAFKCTAGLHHAVRYVDEQTGFQHHGFLNILVALLRARASADRDAVIAALTSDDGQALATEVHAASDDEQRAARQAFVAYGSCSTSAPVEDLAALGLAAPVEAQEQRVPEQQIDQQQ